MIGPILGNDMKKLAHRLVGDRSGNFGIMTALLAVPVLGAAGMAVDFAHALSLRTQLYAAADAAAVGSISEKSDAMTAAMAMSGDGSISLGKTDAQRLFSAQISGELSHLPIDLHMEVAKSGGTLNSTVSFSANMPTTFMQIFGKNSVNIAGAVTAQYQTPTFMDFYMLLDNTPSMGVAATPDDQQAMREATKFGTDGKGKKDAKCAFACHVVDPTNANAEAADYYKLAHDKGITIRIDVVAKATKALMETAIHDRVVDGQFQMSAYTFGQSALDTGLYTVSERTTNLEALGEATKNIALMSIPSHDYPNNQTNFNAVLEAIEDKITSSGAGTSTADRQSILFFVTDGVGDAQRQDCQKKLAYTKWQGKTLPRCMEPLNTLYCDKLKVRNIKIAVLYTTYLPLPENNFYKDWIAPFQDEIPERLKACASPGFYFPVSPSQGIEEAMKALFHKIVSTPRLTS
jgi:Flp pilus assembly protein TadG